MELLYSSATSIYNSERRPAGKRYTIAPYLGTTMIRSFIAIDLPNETRRALASVQEQLKRSQARVRWVNPHSIHLTLKFLGNITPAQIGDIATAVDQGVRHESVLTLCTGGLGAFPSQRNPRVIWVGPARRQPGTVGFCTGTTWVQASSHPWPG